MEIISEIRNEFSYLHETQMTINTLFESLSQKIVSLKTMYVAYVSRVDHVDHNFGVDSLHFQRRFIEQEHDNMRTMCNMINNQMYKDYYSLFKVVTKYVDENLTDKKVLDVCRSKKSYVPYLHLQPMKVYKFDDIVDLHYDILNVITELLSYADSKDRERKIDEGKANHGLNIDNFVTTEKYRMVMIREQVSLFIEYVRVFHKFHIRFLSRFNLKLKLMYGQIQKDIQLEGGNTPVGSNTPQTVNVNESKEIMDFINSSTPGNKMSAEEAGIFANDEEGAAILESVNSQLARKMSFMKNDEKDETEEIEIRSDDTTELTSTPIEMHIEEDVVRDNIMVKES